MIGNKVKVRVVKNKVAPPFKTATLEIIYGEGISYLSELIDLCIEADIIHKSGSWFSYKGNKIGQGRDSVKQYIKEHPEFKEQIEQELKAYEAEQKDVA